MNIDGKAWRTIWPQEVDADGVGRTVGIIDQTRLPHEFATVTLKNVEDAARAIKDMLVRGAPLIGATAAYGVCLALNEDVSDTAMGHAYHKLLKTRPTAINLKWALDEMHATIRNQPHAERRRIAWARAGEIAEQDVAINRAIGANGLTIFKQLVRQKPAGAPLNVLTHCNAGWLATVDWGTATAPIYLAHDEGLPIHVWVDETRPRNQGAALTAWELGRHGVAHTVIPDNSGGLLMRRGLVDAVIVGTDRTTASGDVCNKIGTYLKALAAHDNDVPFYVALPSPTIDFTLDDGSVIPIEERAADEVTHVSGKTADGRIVTVQLTPDGAPAANHAFDVTPARLVSGLITERGVVEANKGAIAALFPERAAA